MKHKKDDVVKITDRKNGHGYKIGEIVKIIAVNDVDYEGELNKGHAAPYFKDDECELYQFGNKTENNKKVSVLRICMVEKLKLGQYINIVLIQTTMILMVYQKK